MVLDGLIQDVQGFGLKRIIYIIVLDVLEEKKEKKKEQKEKHFSPVKSR